MTFNELFRGLPVGASAQAAGLSLGYGGATSRAVSARSGNLRLRCASLLKPLYCWVADPGDAWLPQAEPAVRESSNSDTNRLWHGTGPRVILGRIADRTGVTWSLATTEPSRFGSVEVTAEEVAIAYAALAQAAAAGEARASLILTWMREVADPQTFGLRGSLPEAGIKCGWYGASDEVCLRTHAVTVESDARGRVRVAVALTAQPYQGESDRVAYLSDVTVGNPVEGEHDRLSGPLLRALMGATLSELGGAQVRSSE